MSGVMFGFLKIVPSLFLQFLLQSEHKVMTRHKIPRSKNSDTHTYIYIYNIYIYSVYIYILCVDIYI